MSGTMEYLLHSHQSTGTPLLTCLCCAMVIVLFYLGYDAARSVMDAWKTPEEVTYITSVRKGKVPRCQ